MNANSVRRYIRYAIAIAIAACCRLAGANEPLTLYLNWSVGIDHAPLYFAQAQGWYDRVGARIRVERGAGSHATAVRVATTPNTIGIADLVSVLVARGGGYRAVAVMNIFANSPYTLNWRKRNDIRSLQDLTGRRFGALPNDPTRVLWSAFAKANNLANAAVTWVDIGPNAKAQALRDQLIDVAPNAYFYEENAFELALGGELTRLAWRDAGMNLYGNSLLVNPRLIEQDAQLVRDVTRATQRAYAACLGTPQPCLDAFLAAHPLASRAIARKDWTRVAELMRAKATAPAPFGAFDPARVQADYAIVHDAFNLRERFDPLSSVDNGFLDPDVRAGGPP